MPLPKLKRRLRDQTLHRRLSTRKISLKDFANMRDTTNTLSRRVNVDVSYVVPQAHGIVNVALHREYSPGIVFIFFQGRKDLYQV
jgi:adenylate cyclase